MRTITNEEVMAIMNEVLSLKENAKNNNSILSQLTSEAQEWVLSDVNELKELTLINVIQELYDTQDDQYKNQQIKKAQFIAEFLQQTSNTIYSNVGRKLDALTSAHYAPYKNPKARIAALAICYGTDVKQPYERHHVGGMFTLTDEVKLIKREHKILQKRHAKHMKDFKNIANLYMYPNQLFDDICKVIANKNPALCEYLDKFGRIPSEKLEQFINENYKDIMSFLWGHSSLRFIPMQINLDKIR